MAEISFVSVVEGIIITAPADEIITAADPDGGSAQQVVTVNYLTSGLGGVKNNPNAVVAPTVNDDSGDSYSIGSKWFNSATRELYVASDVTVGAAVWELQLNDTATQTISGAKTFSAITNFSNTTQSTSKDTGAIITEGGLGVEKNAYIGGDLNVLGTLNVATVNTISSTVTEIADANIIVNNGGTQASANSGVAGFTVEMSNATHARIGYDSTLTSKFKLGEVGSEGEVITATAAQAISGKTQIDVDNLRLDGNTVSTTNSNGNLLLTPNGTGTVVATKLNHTGINSSDSENDNATGSNATLTAPTKKIVRLTNGSLASIDMIPAGVDEQELILVNATGVNLTINDDTGATAANRILTGKNAAISLSDEASVSLIYDSVETRWMIVGISGSGSGATTLDELTDVAISSATKGDTLVHNGTQFINSPIANENLLVGGGMDHWLDSTTLSGSTSGFLGTLFRLGGSNDATYNITRSTNVPSGSTALYSAQLEVATADASIGAAQFKYIYVAVEGTDFREIYGKTFTVSGSFWANVTGTYHIALSNAAGDRWYPSPLVYSSGSTWVDVSVTVTHNTTGTWVLDQTNGGLYIWVVLDAGTNYHGTANTWQSGSNLMSSTGQVNFSASSGNIVRLTNFKVERGSVATPYTQASGGLDRYGRYYQKSGSYTSIPGVDMSAQTGQYRYETTSGTGYIADNALFATRMRAAPTITTWDASFNSGKLSLITTNAGAIADNHTITVDNITDTRFRFFTDNTNTKFGYAFSWAANARLV